MTTLHQSVCHNTRVRLYKYGVCHLCSKPDAFITLWAVRSPQINSNFFYYNLMSIGVYIRTAVLPSAVNKTPFECKRNQENISKVKGSSCINGIALPSSALKRFFVNFDFSVWCWTMVLVASQKLVFDSDADALLAPVSRVHIITRLQCRWHLLLANF